MKQILFSLPYGAGFRNIVCCGVVDYCLAQGAHCAALLPALSESDAERVRQELPPEVEVRRLMPAKPSWFFTYLKLAKQHFYARRTALESFQVKYRRRRRQRPLFHAAAAALEFVSEQFLSEATVDDLLATVRQPFEDYYRRIISELHVGTVVIAKPGYQPEDLALIKAARSLQVPTVSVDTTWDNMASKRPPYLRPNALTVWNEQMFGEAVHYYGFETSGVRVTGGAPFDPFFRRDQLPPRDEFISSLGLEPGRKLIVFALNNPLFTPENPGYVEFLLKAIQRGRIRGTPNVVVRMHPWDRDSNFEPVVRNHVRVRLERPFGVPDPASIYECIPSRAEVRYYASLMLHADVVLNIASTTSLDAIAADTPVVNIGFDMSARPPELSSARLYDFSHYRPIVESKAVRLAPDEESFFAAVNAYLEDPDLDATARCEARRKFLTFSDGSNAERIAHAIGELC